jgi:hypothetical protein
VWLHARDAMRRSRLELLASRDPHVPVNGGLFVLRPSLSVYEQGRQALMTMRFSFSHGFNMSGTPQRLLRLNRTKCRLGLDYYGTEEWCDPALGTRMHKANTWNVVDGDGDQGLLAHVFLVLRGGETTSFTSRHSAWRVHHFFGPHKPWGLHARCLRYFDFMDQPDFARGRRDLKSSAALRCLARFEQKRACLQAKSPEICDACRRRRDKNACRFNSTPHCPTSTRWWVL